MIFSIIGLVGYSFFKHIFWIVCFFYVFIYVKYLCTSWHPGPSLCTIIKWKCNILKSTLNWDLFICQKKNVNTFCFNFCPLDSCRVMFRRRQKACNQADPSQLQLWPHGRRRWLKYAVWSSTSFAMQTSVSLLWDPVVVHLLRSHIYPIEFMSHHSEMLLSVHLFKVQ